MIKRTILFVLGACAPMVLVCVVWCITLGSFSVREVAHSNPMIAVTLLISLTWGLTVLCLPKQEIDNTWKDLID